MCVSLLHAFAKRDNKRREVSKSTHGINYLVHQKQQQRQKKKATDGLNACTNFHGVFLSLFVGDLLRRDFVISLIGLHCLVTVFFAILNTCTRSQS